MRVFVHLAYGFDARQWQQRIEAGEVIGLNERLPYGYFRAAEDGCDITYSEDKDENLPTRLFRMAVRWLLGFDFIHAWRNRHEIFHSDVVWTHTESQHLAILLLLLIGRKRRRPKVVAQSVWLFDRWSRFLPFRRLFYSWLISGADVLTVLSPVNLQRARELFPDVRSELVLFGIDTDAMGVLRRHPIQRPIRLLSLGNDEHRDWNTAIAAIRGWQDCEMKIVSRRVGEHRLQGIANVTKAVPRSIRELEALYDWADLVVLTIKPNLHASGITVVLEATVFGLPVICTDAGGLRAYFDQGEVRYVPPRDAAELRRAIAELAADDEARWALVDRARAGVRSRDLSSRGYARRHAELSRQLLRAAESDGAIEATELGTRRTSGGLERWRNRPALWFVAAVVPLVMIGLVFLVRSALPAHSLTIDGAMLDLCAFRPTFLEDFDSLSVSAHPEDHSRWFAHTPWGGDFGDAVFSDPQPGFPFSLRNGVLRIEAHKDGENRWRSGLLSSTRPDGSGFAQRYGYFETRAKLPPGPGVWPGFWLNTVQPRGVKDPSVEIDAFEYYGQFPDAFHSALHIWDNSGGRNNRVTDHVTQVPSGSLYRDFHSYGVDVEPDQLSFYLDRLEFWRTVTPPEMNKPLMLLVDLALGSGWPIDRTPNPSIMEVEYVHAYERDPAGRRPDCK